MPGIFILPWVPTLVHIALVKTANRGLVVADYARWHHGRERLRCPQWRRVAAYAAGPLAGGFIRWACPKK